MSIDKKFDSTPSEALRFDPLDRGLTDLLGSYLELLTQRNLTSTIDSNIEELAAHLAALQHRPGATHRVSALAKALEDILNPDTNPNKKNPLHIVKLEEPEIHSYGGFKMTDHQVFSPYIDDGQTPINLAPIPARLMHILVVNGGRVIPSSRLLDYAWPVGEGNTNTLKTTMSMLRKAVGDQPPQSILAKPHHGYTLVNKR